MDIGDVLSEAWNLYKRFLWQFFLTALVVFAVLDLLSALAGAAAGDSVGAGIFWGLIAFVIGIVGYFWVQGALVELVRDVRDGRADRSIGETYATVQPRLPALIAAGILAALGIGIGLILLIVPGLFLLTIWSMLVPVIVIEGRAAGESFSRSREVVRGHGWPVFGAHPDHVHHDRNRVGVDPARLLAAAELPRRLARLARRAQPHGPVRRGRRSRRRTSSSRAPARRAPCCRTLEPTPPAADARRGVRFARDARQGDRAAHRAARLGGGASARRG